MPLTGKQRNRLRGLAHHLDPVVQIGHEGITDAVVAQIDEALRAHELIKVRLGTEAPVERDAAATEIAARTKSEIAQSIGRIVVVFRRRPKKPKVTLGKATDPKTGKPKGGSGSKGRKPGKSRKSRARPARSRPSR